MGDVLITERLSISNSTSRADNSGPLTSWKSPSYYGVLAFIRRVRESWEALFPPSSDGRPLPSSREAGGGGSTHLGAGPGGCRQRAGAEPGQARGDTGCLPPAKGPRGSRRRGQQAAEPLAPQQGLCLPSLLGSWHFVLQESLTAAPDLMNTEMRTEKKKKINLGLDPLWGGKITQTI